MPPMRKPSPRFASEAEERAYWERTDSTKHVDWSKATRVELPNLKPSTTAISLRLPQGLLDSIKIAANRRDMPYQSLIKAWLAERAGAETVRTPPHHKRGKAR
ncbi:MAG: BrnA antitoxin family protein [Tagaea sp.]